ncbi:MAG: replicative DNA helicase [Candidatus Magnetomorum sp.]|nr:replicative DNA helicase [Candidatus Magnetomorum sp.]
MTPYPETHHPYQQRSSHPEPSLDAVRRIPPQSIEAEESLLCAILLDSSLLLDIVEILDAPHFYITKHQMIFQSMLDLFKKSEPIDLVTITNHLRDRNALDTIGGATALSRLVNEIPMAINPPQYANIIREKALLRDLISKASTIVTQCFENQGNIESVIDFAESAVYEVSQDKIKPSFYSIQDVVNESFKILEERSNNDSPITGVTTGFDKLNYLTAGFQPSDLIILAARPSMGKTAFALNLTRNAAIDAQVPVAFFSLEMSKEQLAMRMLCSEARVDSSKLRGGSFSQEDWEQLTHAASIISESPIFIDDSPAQSALQIRAKCRRLHKTNNVGLIIIDYLQLMRTNDKAERRDLAIGEISGSMKALAKELNVPVIALSQLNRKLEERGDKRPILSDLRESGSLEQDADLVIFIYRDEVYNKDETNPNKGLADILLRKQRNGPTGEVVLRFNGAYTRFDDLAPEEVVHGY